MRVLNRSAIFLLAFLALWTLGYQSPAAAQGWSNGYSYRRAVTIDHTKVPNTDQSNFPFLFSSTYSDLATTSNGGAVTNANGYDIIFTSDAAGTTILPFEPESYNPSTGAVNYWVQIPTLSHTTDTVIYLFYGNSSVTTDQSNKHGVWDSNFVVVSHLSDNAANTTVSDSTSNGNNLTNLVNTSSKSASGEISNGLSYNGSGDYSKIANNSSVDIQGSTITLEAWIKPTNSTAASSERLVVKEATSNSDPYVRYGLIRSSSGSSQLMFYISTGGSGSGTAINGGSTSAGTWTHVVGVYNGSTMTLYVNGSSVTSTSKSGNIGSSPTPLVFGADTEISGEYFNGVLDEARVSKSARSADWIATEYKNQSAPATFATVGSATCAIISSLSPTSGAIGSSVTITGMNFGSSQGSSTVSFAGATATATSWSPTQIIATVPTGAISGNVIVTAAGVQSNAVHFTVTGGSWSNGYTYRRAVTIDHTKISNTDQTNFPLLFSGKYAYLATTGNGGCVTNSNGYDIIFALDEAGTRILPFERESYDPATGTVTYWVQIPSVSHTFDTVIFLFYGNSSVTTDQSNKNGTWDSNYKGVWHFNQTPNGSGSELDSTSNGYNGTPAASGISLSSDGIAGASLKFDGVSNSNGVAMSSSVPGGTPVTASIWIETTGLNSTAQSVIIDKEQWATAGWGIDDNGQYDPHVFFRSLPNPNTIVNIPRSAVNDGKWHYLVGTVDSSNHLNLYLDGSLYGTVTPSSVTANTSGALSVGGFGGNAGGGLLTEVHVSNAVRSADWIATEYNNQNSPLTFYNEGSPQIISLSPNSGGFGTSVTIAGNNFGSTQGTSTATFGGAAAVITSWSNTSIVATVPAGASSGNVIVTVSGIASNGINFTVFPTGWTDQDVGSVAVAGNASYSGSTGLFTVKGGGNFNQGIEADTFNFAYQPLSGDGTIVARVVSVSQGSDPYYQDVGIMIRETLNAGSTMAFVGYQGPSSGGGSIFMYRSTTGGGANGMGGPSGNPPWWFKLVRSGSSFTAYTGVDGLNWTWLTTQTITMGTNAYIGLAVTSDDNADLVTAAFDDVSITSGATTPPLISGVSSDNGSVGTQITITGSGFGASQGYSAVFLGDVSAPVGSWSNTSIVIQVPTGASTGYLVVAVAPSMNDSNPVDFTVSSNPLPSPWLSQDIGPVNTMGSASYASSTGAFTVKGGGTINVEIGGTADLFYFVYQPLSGDGTIVSRLPSLQGSNSYAEAGLMIRETLNAGSTMAFLGYDNAGPGTYLKYRTATGANASTAGGPGVTLPYWLMLIRSGNTFTAYTAPDGVNWTQFTSQTITMATNVYVGLAVSSDYYDLATATFDHVAVSNSASVITPSISSLTPSAAPIGGQITIQGTAFGSSQSSSTVQFNNLTASVLSWSSTSIKVTVPSNATSGPVTVTVGGVVSNGVQFTLIESLTITGISPSSGPIGTSLRITGTGFGPSQSNSILALYGATVTNITSWSDTSIVAVVPTGSATGPVALTVAGNNVQGPTFTLITGANITDSLGNTSSYQGEMWGGQWRLTNSQGSGCTTCEVRGVISNAFDAHGNTVSSTDPMGNNTTYSYNANNDLASRTSPVDSTYNATTSYSYNSLGEVLTQTDALGNVTTNAYDGNGNLTSVTMPAPNGGTAASVTQFSYNSLGELTTITDPLGHVTTMTYTTAGLIATITDAQTHVTTYGYDTHGNRTSITDANNQTTTLTYDAGDRLTKITYPDNTTTTFGYDIRGRRTSVTDQNGKATSYAYDDGDRLTSKTDAANHTTTYAYDTEDNLTTLTDANTHSTFFTYDAFGRVTHVNFPSSFSESYAFDANNNLTSKTDRKGQTIVYTYDDLNRLTSKNYPDTTSVTYTYDLDSNVLQVTDPTGTYAFSYDNMGRLTGTTTTYNFVTGRNFTTSYGYDAVSNRTGFTDPEGGVTSYSYDTLDQLTALVPPTAFGSGSFGFSYDVLNHRTQMTRPNNVSTNYTYDRLSRLLSVLHQVGSSTIDGESYGLDSAGNRTSKTDRLANVTSNYTYDQIYELTQVTQGSNTVESYSYDPVGNRTSSLGVPAYNYNNTNELTSTSSASYTYDNNGNETSKTDSTGTTTYAWDFENRLASVTLPGNGGTVSFKYDPRGRRIYKSSASGISVFAYDGDNLTEETTASGAVVARYIQGLDTDDPFAMLRAGATSFYNTDGLGSVTSLANTAGSLAQTYTSDSFGKLTGTSGALTNNFQYTSREVDPETNLSYYRARYYDTTNGRFISEDPLEFSTGVNFYDYVMGNPTNLSDPKGLDSSRGNASGAWRHYCDGSGTAWTIPFSEINWDTSKVDTTVKGLIGPSCWERLIPVSLPSVPISGAGSDYFLVGHHSVKVRGMIQVRCDCTWTFIGEMSSVQGYDEYNFHGGDIGSDINYVIGRTPCPRKGRPFEINLPGATPVSTGGVIDAEPTCPCDQ